MKFRSNILIIPGLGNSVPGHWQTLWEKQFNFKRIEQQDWETPVCSDWIANIAAELEKYDPANVILVGHSLACTTIAYWAQRSGVIINGALLVAPSDTEAASFPPGTTGFMPVPLNKLPFPSIMVTSTNDFYVTYERAKLFADAWGSELVNIGEAGHININSGFGQWGDGLTLLKRLDEL